MDGYQLLDFERTTFSVAMTEAIDEALSLHLAKGPLQEDLTFAYWKPSQGARRYTAILNHIVLPNAGDRILQGNVAFAAGYLQRVLRDRPPGCGIALLHSHLGPGWQDMSRDDEVAERDRLGGAVAAATNLPVLGLTRGTNGSWSARFWLREDTNRYVRRDCATVRVLGKRLLTTFHPRLAPTPAETARQPATISVWGSAAQADIARTRVGIVGLGSVGSIISEALSRMGLEAVSFIDMDLIEERNLDRTLNAHREDVPRKLPKVAIAERGSQASHTSERFEPNPVPFSLLTTTGLAAALDCDVLISCVDRPWPRAMLNLIAKAHLVPAVDGGILARVDHVGRPLHIDWRIHTVGPNRPCLYCVGAVLRSDVGLDRAGKLDDPDYIRGLSPAEREKYARRNVFPFSLAVAAHQTLQFVGLVTGMERVGGIGPQRYHAYPGEMVVQPPSDCDPECEVDELTGTACDLKSWLQDPSHGPTGSAESAPANSVGASVPSE
jgi:hypothetical protein